MKLRHRLDFSRIPRLTQNKPCLLSKFQNLNKVLHSKNQLHDMSRVVEYLFLLVPRYVGTDLLKTTDCPKACLDFV